MNKPKISVILPTYNGFNHLENAVQSIFHQTFPYWELIIVNDGSQDETHELIGNCQWFSDPRVRYIQHHENKGIAAAYNTGIKNANAKFIAFQEQDDISLPSRLAIQKKLLDGNSLALLTTRAAWINESGIIYKYWPSETESALELFPPNYELFVNLLVNQTIFPNTTSMINRSLISNEDLWLDEQFRTSGQDWDMHLRFSLKYPIARLRNPLVHMKRNRAHESATSNKTRMFKENRLILRKHGKFLRKRFDYFSLLKAWSNELVIEARYSKGMRGLVLGWMGLMLWPTNPKGIESLKSVSGFMFR